MPISVAIDTSTLDDLGILRAPGSSGTTLMALVDKTSSDVARAHLRRLLSTPFRSAEDIRQRQRAHQILADDEGLYRGLIHSLGIDDVVRYLDSNWQLPRDRRGRDRVAWLWFWHRTYIADVTAGRAAILRVLSVATELQRRFASSDAALLQGIGNSLSRELSAPALGELQQLGTGASDSALERFDQRSRGEARTALRRIIDSIGLVEAMWSLGVATVEHGWVYPRLDDSLKIEGLWHAFLSRNAAVTTDLALDGHVRVCFITGPNMAGKSTFLKATAIAVLLAHCGAGVPAAAMQFRPLSAIFSSVQMSDDLDSGKSFYLAEVHRVRELASVLREHQSALAVIDEPFRGTNVHDAAEATMAIMSKLAQHPRAIVLIASHVTDIAQDIEGDNRIRLLHFSAELVHDEPRFDYLLRNGVSTQRLGMTLLRREGVLDLLDQSTRDDRQPLALDSH